MLKVNLSDGRTASIDLADEAQAREFLRDLGNRDFQARVSSMAITNHGVQYALPRPTGFRDVVYLAEPVPVDDVQRIKGGERLSCISDDVRVTLMVYESQRAVRVQVTKTGRQRFNPLTR